MQIMNKINFLKILYTDRIFNKELIIMILMNGDWKRMILAAGRLLEESCDMLSGLDSLAGDGDHGVTIKKIAYILEMEAEDWAKEETLKSFLEKIGYRIMNVSGGPTSSLWGALFAGFGEGAKDEEGISVADLKNMFEASYQFVSELTNARIGDKTMMDAFVPAVDSILKSDRDILNMLSDAAEAAKKGADKTADYIAKYGRGKALKERSLGHKDPGAVSISILLDGFAQGAVNPEIIL